MPRRPWRGKGAKKVIYGWEKGLKRPKTNAEKLKIYAKDKHYIYASSLQVDSVKYGAGQSGARHFRYHNIPPLRFWNPDVDIRERKLASGTPRVTVSRLDGQTKEWEVLGKKAEEILDDVLDFCGEYVEERKPFTLGRVD